MLHQIFMYSDKVSWLVKITIHISFSVPPTELMNWPINDVHVSNLKWRKKIPCHNIHVFYIHYYITRLWNQCGCAGTRHILARWAPGTSTELSSLMFILHSARWWLVLWDILQVELVNNLVRRIFLKIDNHESIIFHTWIAMLLKVKVTDCVSEL